MDKPNCAWLDGCERLAESVGLCNMHIQRARRLGLTETYRALALASRSCEHCGTQILPGRRLSARYCDHKCANAATWAANKDERLRAHKEWRDSTRARRLAESARRLLGKLCEECGAPILDAKRPSRRFCSRRCINQVSLRERRAERLEAHRRRHKLIRQADGPGVATRDWERLVRRFAGRCAYCSCIAPLTMDHVVPLTRGGRHAIGNILPACRSCNSSKRNDLLVYWRRGIPQARLKVA